jgi:hypothetical protein
MKSVEEIENYRKRVDELLESLTLTDQLRDMIQLHAFHFEDCLSDMLRAYKKDNEYYHEYKRSRVTYYMI